MPKISTRQDTRSQLLDAGMSIMLEKGYNATGILEVLQAVGIPKGSFYYYFQSKENFGLEIINYFEQIVSQKLHNLLDNKQASPVEKLKAYCEQGRQDVEAQDCKKGCLIGKLSQEMAEQNELFRQRLEQVLSKWRSGFANCIAEGQRRGEIAVRHSPDELAEFFLSGWEGAVMRSKTTRTTQPQRIFSKLMFDDILKP